MKAAIRVLKYLKNSSTLGLFFPAFSDFKLLAYSDSDWATCSLTRKSTTGYTIYYGNSLISYKTKKQKTVARSSTEAEYRTMATTTSEITWLIALLKDLQHFPPIQPTYPSKFRPRLLADSTSAIQIAHNPVNHERTKYIEVDVHFVREKAAEGVISLEHVSTLENLTDFFTKSLSNSHFCRIISKLGMNITNKCIYIYVNII